jgi:hypothetical protein
MAPNTTAPEVDLSRLRSLLARPGLQSAWITVEELRALLDAVDQRSRLAVRPSQEMLQHSSMSCAKPRGRWSRSRMRSASRTAPPS